ncbi:2'-5' RNA ligase family protein [bacterium]|nr:MAG: 2'-5' RNA ligase family protein [bacterium]
MNTCILTARLDEVSQNFFNEMRDQHFPKEINLLKAHLTLFHKLPDTFANQQILQSVKENTISGTVTSLKNIGNGVAYFLDIPALNKLHIYLQKAFNSQLILQDKQGIRPHVTIQNKVTPEEARKLLEHLTKSFKPFQVSIEGLDLWHYLSGPWQHYQYFPFKD